MSDSLRGSRYYSLVTIHELKSALPGVLPVQSSILIKMPPTSLLPLSTHNNDNRRSTLRIYCPLFAAASVFPLKLVTSHAVWRHVPLSFKVITRISTSLCRYLSTCIAVLCGRSQALISRKNGAVIITILPPCQWKLKDGQHINVRSHCSVCGPSCKATLHHCILGSHLLDEYTLPGTAASANPKPLFDG